jgi:glycosyltransferase involved in cell wall biosynthesis
VLPTLSDGFAITQLEAMAHALPLVVTPNCGRVVTDGIDGFIIPARDGQALAEALVRFDNDRTMLRHMSENALRTALRHNLPSNGVAIQKLVREFRANQRVKQNGMATGSQGVGNNATTSQTIG